MAARVGGPGKRRLAYVAAALAAHLALLGAMGLGLHNAGGMAEVAVVDLDLTPVNPAMFPRHARQPAHPAAKAAEGKAPAAPPARPEPSASRSTAAAPAPSAVGAAPVRPRIGAGPTGQPMGPVADNPAQASVRASTGCDSASYVGLTAAEIARCDERNRRLRAKNRSTYAVIDQDKKDFFDGTCKRDDVWCLYYKGEGPYPGLMALIGKRK